MKTACLLCPDRPSLCRSFCFHTLTIFSVSPKLLKLVPTHPPTPPKKMNKDEQGRVLTCSWFRNQDMVSEGEHFRDASHKLLWHRKESPEKQRSPSPGGKKPSTYTGRISVALGKTGLEPRGHDNVIMDTCGFVDTVSPFPET